MRLLVLTHTFPPSYISNAKRPFYLVQGFLEAGWEVDVFTSTFGMHPGQAETVHHKALRIFRPEDRLVSLEKKALEKSGAVRAAKLAASALLWPDTYLFWTLKVLKLSRRAGIYDRTLIFILPGSLLVSGLLPGGINRRCIFDYQESVTPQFRRHARRSPLQRLLAPLLGKLERRTLHKAGKIVFTAETNRQAYIEAGLAPEKNSAHIPYFFDAAVFREPPPPESPSPPFQIVYFGTFDWRGERSPETFLRALGQFLEKRPEARAQTRFSFYGNWLSEHDRHLDNFGLRDVASIQPSIPYQEYLRKLKQSPILLLVVSSAHNLFMPSKIVDYFGAGRPILAFVPRESEMRRVLEQAKMADFASDEFDSAGGAAAIELLWQRHASGTLSCRDARAAFWSSEVQVPRYLELVARSG